MDNGDDSDEALPISQLAQRFRATGTGYDTARRRIERAIREERLPAHRGYWGGRLLTLVYRADFERWRADQAPGDGRRTTQGDDPDDDDVVAWAPRGASARLAATLRDVQAGAIGEVSRQLEPLWDRLEALSARCGRLEAENAQLRQRVWEFEQGQAPKRRLWRWW